MKKCSFDIFTLANKTCKNIKKAADTVRSDISASKEINNLSSLEVVLFDDGFHAIETHRVASFVNLCGFPRIAKGISELAKYSTGIEISPLAKIGKGVAIHTEPKIKIAEDGVCEDGSVIGKEEN